MRNKSISTIAKTSLLSALVFSGISWKQPRRKNLKRTDYNRKWFYFSDLNKNGKLDKYEDYRLPINERIQDLIKQNDR